ncbi:MAG: hypothetical protein IPF92_20025 [Myxococcales bacterium]|nr:hypothetical protein [Myxococcales bacterium]MBL0197083.1 hypothetical protein [Myxococcales bacterium]
MMAVGRAAAAALFLAALSACEGAAPAPPAPAPSASVTSPPPPPAPPPSVPPPRTLVTGTLRPGSPENLLIDPGFSGAEQGEQGAGGFLAYFAKTFARFTPVAVPDSASPAGHGGNVLALSNATVPLPRAIEVVLRFTGGKGPFVAEVWMAARDPEGAARPWGPTGPSATILAPAADQATTLAPDQSPPRQASGRSWTRFTGTFSGDIVGAGLLVVNTGSLPGTVDLAAPQVLAVPIVSTLGRATSPRSLRPEERATVAFALSRAPGEPGLPSGGAPPRPRVGPRLGGGSR